MYSQTSGASSAGLQNLLDSRAHMAAKGQAGPSQSGSPTDHSADLLRMTRESMNGSFSSKLTGSRQTLGKTPPRPSAWVLQSLELTAHPSNPVTSLFSNKGFYPEP